MNAPFPHQTEPPKPEVSELLGPLRARRVVKKAVILAAGRGRRMGKLTKDRPKAALEVGGHALIDWQIAALQAAGVEEIAVVTGHGAQALAGRGVTYIHNPAWDKGTQVATLLCARDWIGDEPVIVSYGDIIYHPCAPLALLERPGDIIIAYDADHRWLWKRRFGNWLKDSETFRLGPGQVLTEIGGKPTDIEEMDGQFMGLMLVTAGGLDVLARRFRETPEEAQRKLDFTKLLSGLLAEGGRVDTAANVLPWMEVDGAKDLKIAQAMNRPNDIKGVGPELIFPTNFSSTSTEDAEDVPDSTVDASENRFQEFTADATAQNELGRAEHMAKRGGSRPESHAVIGSLKVKNAFAVQNWGRSGSTLVQALFDDHAQVLSTPNFYSRSYYIAWATLLSRVPDSEKLSAFVERFQQWWDTGRVDATAGLHRLGPERREIGGVSRERLEQYLRAVFSDGRQITRRNLFEAAHLAYALARGQRLDTSGLHILFPIHGEPRGTAAAFIEDFPEARFIHTVREPVTNFASSIQHLSFNNFDLRRDALESVLNGLFGRSADRYARTQTPFLDRPYFPYLVAADQARLLRLEDLHRDGDEVMATAAHWLGLSFDKGLTIGTWDGKLWWNRPESGKDSHLGGQDLLRNVSSRLDTGDATRVRMLLRATPAIQAAYHGEATTNRRGPMSWAAALVRPWRQERLARRSEVRSLEALLSARWILPRRFVASLQEALKRERYRTKLLEMGSGAGAIRKKLSDAQKPYAIRAVLLLTPLSDGFRIRALAGAGPAGRRQLEEADRLAVVYLDEATHDRSVAGAVFWVMVLTIGWKLARLQTFFRIRRLTCRLLFSRSPIFELHNIMTNSCKIVSLKKAEIELTDTIS